MIVLADRAQSIYKPWALHGDGGRRCRRARRFADAFSYKVYKLWWLKNFVASRSHERVNGAHR